MPLQDELINAAASDEVFMRPTRKAASDCVDMLKFCRIQRLGWFDLGNHLTHRE